MNANLIRIVCSLCVLLLVSFDASSSTATTKVAYRKSTHAPKFNITTMGDETAPSHVDCARRCSESNVCVFFKWVSTTGVCSLYQQASAGVVPSAFSADMYMRQGPLPCTGVRVRVGNGKCMCPVGLYDHECSTPFIPQLSLQQQFYMDWGIDVNHLEIDAVSFIFLLSLGNGSVATATVGGYIVVYSRDSQVSATYAFRQIIMLNTKCQRLHPFQVNDNSYFVVSNAKIVGQASTTVPHILYKYDPVTQTFAELNRWSEIGGGMSALYQRPNGDTYLNIAANNVNGTQDQNPYIYKFDPSTESFARTFSIPHTGIHKYSVLFEIEGQLYSMTSIYNSLASVLNKIYRLNADETWSWYQDVPLTNHTFIQSIDVYTSPQLTLLVAGNMVTSKVHVYQWDGMQFNFLQQLSAISTLPYTPRLLEVAGSVYLLVDDNNAISKLFNVFRYNDTSSQFDFFTSVNADGPMGRFQQFWYDDNLYLLATNNFNGSYSAGSALHFRANQQLFQWL